MRRGLDEVAWVRQGHLSEAPQACCLPSLPSCRQCPPALGPCACTHPALCAPRSPSPQPGHKCVCVKDGLPTWVCEIMVTKPNVSPADCAT